MDYGVVSRLSAYARTLSVAYATQSTHMHTYGGAAQLEVGVPHDECVLALGFELHPVEPCSPRSVRMLRRLCPARPTLAVTIQGPILCVFTPNQVHSEGCAQVPRARGLGPGA